MIEFTIEFTIRKVDLWRLNLRFTKWIHKSQIGFMIEFTIEFTIHKVDSQIANWIYDQIYNWI